MNFAIYNTSKRAFKKAGAAVIPNWRGGGGFTLLELMVVVILIGILSSLAYSSFTDIIFSNRAKETAQTIRTFTEKSLMDAKRQNKTIRICVKDNAIIAEEPAETACGTGTKISSETLSQGYSPATDPLLGSSSFNGGVSSQIRIGLSGIAGEGYFAACGARGYCGGAVKLNTENSFKAYIRKGTGKQWEEL